MLFCDVPFNMLISGMTDCGKTYYVLDLLEQDFLKTFDYIVIFCPSIEMNKTYQHRKWVDNDPYIYVYPPDKTKMDLNSALEDAMNVFRDSDAQTLFLIDDCANLWESKNKCTKLTELGFSGRHYGISVWLITQKYNAVCKDFRENCKHMIIHTMNDQASFDQIFRENRCLPLHEKNNIIEELDADKKLLLRRTPPLQYNIEEKKCLNK